MSSVFGISNIHIPLKRFQELTSMSGDKEDFDINNLNLHSLKKEINEDN